MAAQPWCHLLHESRAGVLRKNSTDRESQFREGKYSQDHIIYVDIPSFVVLREQSQSWRSEVRSGRGT